VPGQEYHFAGIDLERNIADSRVAIGIAFTDVVKRYHASIRRLLWSLCEMTNFRFFLQCACLNLVQLISVAIVA